MQNSKELLKNIPHERCQDRLLSLFLVLLFLTLLHNSATASEALHDTGSESFTVTSCTQTGEALVSPGGFAHIFIDQHEILPFGSMLTASHSGTLHVTYGNDEPDRILQITAGIPKYLGLSTKGYAISFIDLVVQSPQINDVVTFSITHTDQVGYSWCRDLHPDTPTATATPSATETIQPTVTSSLVPTVPTSTATATVTETDRASTVTATVTHAATPTPTATAVESFQLYLVPVSGT